MAELPRLAILGQGDELGVLHPVGADSGDVNPPGEELVVEGFRIALEKGLGGRVDPQAGHGLEGGGGAQLQHPAAPGEVGQAQLGHPHGGPAVEVDHPQAVRRGDRVDPAHFAHAGGAHQPGDGGLLPGQQVPEGIQGLGVGQVQGDRAHRAGAQGRQLAQPVLPPGDGPDRLNVGVPADLAGEFPAQAAGGPGDEGNVHTAHLLLWGSMAGTGVRNPCSAGLFGSGFGGPGRSAGPPTPPPATARRRTGAGPPPGGRRAG
ncbi:unknown [Firmicutes bacterium CAG:114]|nr:unknown [Firmicutes bacterium CAG:114]